MSLLLSVSSGWTGTLGPFTLLVNQVPLALTGFTVQVILHDFRGRSVTPGGTVTVNADQGANPGKVTYTPASTDFVYRDGFGADRRQVYRIHWKVTDGSGAVVFFPNGDADEIAVYRT